MSKQPQTQEKQKAEVKPPPLKAPEDDAFYGTTKVGPTLFVLERVIIEAGKVTKRERLRVPDSLVMVQAKLFACIAGAPPEERYWEVVT